jgi:ribosomal protein L37AE/L43A
MYTTDKLKNMKYHLNRKIKCNITNLACVNYTDEEIEEESLIRINKRNNLKCEFCKKTYTNKITLLIHQKNYCKKINKESLDEINKNSNEYPKDTKDAKDTIINETNIINNNITNNITNNIININLPISFDKEWNIEHIDNYLKTLLLICDNKFTFFLDNVLKNKINLNVVLDKNMSEAYVFTDNEYKNIEKDELLSKSMEKIYNHLIKIKNEFNDTQDN